MTRPALNIRRGAADDLGAVMAIMMAAFDPRHGEAWTTDQSRATFALPGYRWWLASCDGEAIGFLLARATGDESELMLLAVEPLYRGLGSGMQLVETWLRDCKADGIVRHHLEMREGNRAAGLYRRFGFAEIGRRRDYYRGADGVTTDAVTMAFFQE